MFAIAYGETRGAVFDDVCAAVPTTTVLDACPGFALVAVASVRAGINNKLAAPTQTNIMR